MRDHCSRGIHQQLQKAASAQQAALMQTIRSVVCSVLCILLLANVGIYYFAGPKSHNPEDLMATVSTELDQVNKSSETSISLCNIEHRWAKNFSLDEFRTKFRLQKPVMLTFENGSADWLAVGGGTAWSLDWLAAQFGSYESLAGRPIDIVHSGGRGLERVNFGQFIRDIRNSTCGEQRCIFSREFFHATRMDSTLRFPQVMGYNNKDHDLLFFLGGNGSGASFHRHSDAWNAMITGRKYWILYPGDRAPPGGVHHAFEPHDWLNRVYKWGSDGPRESQKQQQPIQCFQAPGEILYIPEGYYHATISLMPTLCIGIQSVKPVGSAEALFNDMKDKSPAELDTVISKALKLLPHNTQLLHKLAMCRKQQEKLQDAEKLLERALSMDGSFLVAILDLAEIKWKFFGKTLEADALYKQALDLNPNYWEVHVKYGEFLAYQTGELERAVEALEKAANLRGNELVIWQLLRTIHDFAGNATGAAAADEKIDQLSIIDDQLIDF